MFHKYLKTLLCVIWTLYSPVLSTAHAQLELPPLPTPRPEIYYNGYTASTTPAQALGDLDRDQRFGPPYGDDANGEDGSDDFRVSCGERTMIYIH